jgi:hypothetical protein
MPRFRHVASALTVGAGVASLSVLSATAVGASILPGGPSSISNSDNNNNNTTQSNSASTSGPCSPIQQQNNRDIDNSNDVSGGDAGNGGTGGSGGSSVNTNIPIASPGTGNGNSAGGNGGTGGNGGNAHGSANAGNQVQIVKNCGNTTVNPAQVVTSTVTVPAPAAAPVVSAAHFTG